MALPIRISYQRSAGLTALFRDARFFQIIYLSLFLGYGLSFLGWDAQFDRYFIIVSSCLVTQFIGLALTSRKFSSLRSALITALGLCLLLKANEPWTLILGASLAIASKFLIRFKGKHLFNPANFGIVMAVLLTGDAWISPGQWGNNAILVYFFTAAALMVLLKVGRIDTSLTFLIVFGLLEYGRTVLFLGWESEVLVHKLSNGTFLLFTFFMITDPVTTPNAPKARIIWAAIVAGLTFGMTNWFYLHTAPIWALFFISPLTVLLDRWFHHKKFNWKVS